MKNLKLALILITVTNLGNYALMGMNSKKRVRSDSAQFDPELVPQATRHRFDPVIPDNDVEMAQASASSSSSSASMAPAKSKDQDGDHLMVERKVNAAAQASISTIPPIPYSLTDIIYEYYAQFNPWDYVEAFKDLKDGIQLRSLNELSKKISAQDNDVYQLDGNRIAVIYCNDEGNIIEIWNVITQKIIATINDKGEKYPVANIIKLHDGKIACSYTTSCIKIFDLNKKTPLISTITCAQPDEDLLFDLSITQLEDGRIVSNAAFYENNANLWGTIECWDPDTYKSIFKLTNNQHDAPFIQKLKDGKIVAYSDSGVMCLWDINKVECIARQPGLPEYQGTSSVTQLPNGNIISVAGVYDEGYETIDTLRIWNLTNNTATFFSMENIRSITNLILLSETRVAFSEGKNLFVWDIITNKMAAVFEYEQPIKKLILLDNFKILMQTKDNVLHIVGINPTYIKIVQEGLLPAYERPASSSSSSSSSSSAAPMNCS